jgi:hypothetical protein
MSSSSSYWGAYARKMNVWGGHMNGTKSIDEGRIPITHGSHQINHFGGAMDFNRTIETNYPPDHCYVADGWLNQEPYKWFFLGDDLTSGAPWFHFGVGYMGEHGADDRLDLNSYALPWIAVEGDRIQYTAKMGTGFSHDGDTSRCGARTSLANLWTQVGWTLFLAAATGPLPWTKGLAISAIADLFLAILEDSANAHHDDWLYRCLNAHYANIDDYDEAVFGAGNRSYRALYPNGTFDVKRFVTHNGDYYKAYSGMFGYEADPGVPPGQRVDAKFLVCWEVKTEGQWPEYQEGGTSYETHARAQAGPCWNVQVRLEA